MKTKSKKIFWVVSIYVFLLLVFGWLTLSWKFHVPQVENYQVTTLKLDKSKPTYYVELNGKRADVSLVKSIPKGTKVLLYEGLEVTGLKIAEADCVYVFSGALSEDEVLQRVHHELCAPWAMLFSLILFFGGMFVVTVYKHEKL